MVESGPVKKSRKQLLQRPRDLALLTGLLVSALTVLLSFHSTCLLTEQKSLTSAELLSSLLNTTTTNTTAVVSTTATQNQRKTNSNETDKKKNLVIVNAVGQRSNLPLNVHAMDNHFSQDDWDCILFMYMNETVIPDDDDNLWKLQQEERCAVIRTPGIPWGVFLQFLPPLLVNQYEYIAVLLDDIYLPRQGKRPINVPRLLSQMQTHNLSSITPGIVSDNHRVLNPNKHKDYQDCLVEVKFIETFFQIFTLPAWKCFYNLLHYKGGRGNTSFRIERGNFYLTGHLIGSFKPCFHGSLSIQ